MLQRVDRGGVEMSKKFDDLYDEWSGGTRLTDSCHPVLASEQAIDFAEQCCEEIEKENASLKQRIAELEKSQIVWHKIKDKKPCYEKVEEFKRLKSESIKAGLLESENASLKQQVAEMKKIIMDCAEWMESGRASGDWGFWDWDEDDVYTKAIATIKKYEVTK